MNKEQLLAYLRFNYACEDACWYVIKHPSDDLEVIYLDVPDPSWWTWLFGVLEDNFDEYRYLINEEIFALSDELEETVWGKAHNQLSDMVQDEFNFIFDELLKERLAESSKFEIGSGEHKAVYDKFGRTIRTHQVERNAKERSLRDLYTVFAAPAHKKLASKIVADGLLPDWKTVVLPAIKEQTLL
jgi:hypothetical protein